MQNTAQIYERKYNNIFDILSEIGGVVQFIFYIFYWINFSYNRYTIAFDTNNLFFTVRAENNGINGLKFDNLKRKAIKDIPKNDNSKKKILIILIVWLRIKKIYLIIWKKMIKLNIKIIFQILMKMKKAKK
jgi:hypothetical protein